jgi:ribose transport system ATP-binding protein
LGLAGLIGAGRTESLRAIFGLDPIRAGSIKLVELSGASLKLAGSTRGRIRRGVGMLSEDRKAEGLALDLSVGENIVLSSPKSIASLGVIRRTKLKAASEHWIKMLSIRNATGNIRARNLSGGNQQKVAIARLLQMQADVFLLDEPTRGIDIGSKVEIYRLLAGLAEAGKAILFVSSYLPELLGVCDRIGVMCRGELVAIRSAQEWSEQSIMLAATGGKPDA